MLITGQISPEDNKDRKQKLIGRLSFVELEIRPTENRGLDQEVE